MIQIRKAKERGHMKIDWLDSYHTFSFADYYDPNYIAFRSLRVINEDRVQPNSGFSTHYHRDMEIITYVLEGELEHKDSLGNGSIIRPGEVQKMSAGSGIQHSEFNPSSTQAVHLLQIWIIPDEKNLPPYYEQIPIPAQELKNQWKVIGDHQKSNQAVSIHQDVSLLASQLENRKELMYEFKKGRYGWLQIAKGRIKLNGNTELFEGDGAAISNTVKITLQAIESAEILLFDLN